MLLVLAAAPICDLLARRWPNRVSLWGGVAVLVSLPLRFAVAQTAVWHTIAIWIIR
jgi:Flp pilus assembly protein protease CpaA